MNDCQGPGETFQAVLRICITLMRIRTWLINLMRIQMRILIYLTPNKPNKLLKHISINSRVASWPPPRLQLLLRGSCDGPRPPLRGRRPRLLPGDDSPRGAPLHSEARRPVGGPGGQAHQAGGPHQGRVFITGLNFVEYNTLQKMYFNATASNCGNQLNESNNISVWKFSLKVNVEAPSFARFAKLI